jgi:O-acetyl-ADP-ribose deacetylase (regulator of RNase III)
MVKLIRVNDIFDIDADAYVNTVNCVGVMGKGVALAFKARYPALMTQYKRYCRNNMIMPGELMIWRSPDKKWVFNVATKDHWRNPSRYTWVRQGLNELYKFLVNMDIKTIVIPPLGCGCGGLDWNEVWPMIHSSLNDLDMEVLVIEPN